MRLYKCATNENDFVLPLYHKTHNQEENVIEFTEKPDLTSFVVPGLNVDQVGFPLSPPISSSGLKRRTVSMNNFGTGAVAPSPTPTRLITPFKHDSPDIKQPV